MSRRHCTRARRAAGALTLAAMAVAGLLAAAPGRGQEAPAATAPVTAQPFIGLPRLGIVLMGAPSAGAPGEVLGYAGTELVRRTDARGWEVLGAPRTASGEPFATWEFFDAAQRERRGSGSVSARGAAAAIGRGAAAEGEPPQHAVVLHEPGDGPLRALPAPVDDPDTPELEGALEPGESLARWSDDPTAVLAAVDEPSGRAGGLVAPVHDSAPVDGILHWDGERWIREPIEPPAGQADLGTRFQIVALDAPSLDSAYFLAAVDPALGRGAVLYRREASGRWVEQPIADNPRSPRCRSAGSPRSPQPATRRTP